MGFSRQEYWSGVPLPSLNTCWTSKWSSVLLKTSSAWVYSKVLIEQVLTRAWASVFNHCQGYSNVKLLGETHWLKPPTLTRHHSKPSGWVVLQQEEHRTNKPPPTRRVQERSKGDATCPSISQNPSCWHPSCLSNGCPTGKKPESEWLAWGTQKLILSLKTRDGKPHGRAILLGSLTLLLSTRMPLPNKVSYLSAHVSPPIIHFWVLDKNHLLGPVRSPRLCKKKSGLRFTDLGCWKILKYVSYLSNEVCIITGSWKLNSILFLNFRLL